MQIDGAIAGPAAALLGVIFIGRAVHFMAVFGEGVLREHLKNPERVPVFLLIRKADSNVWTEEGLRFLKSQRDHVRNTVIVLVPLFLLFDLLT